MNLETSIISCFVIMMISLSSRVFGRSIDELIAEASETMNFYLEDLESGTVKHELDMILTLKQYRALLESSSSMSSKQTGRPKRKALKQTTYRWTNNVIPYKIVSNIFSDSDKVEIHAAIAEWQNYTCLSFRTATSSDVNYVSIDNGDGCYSYVGMIGGPQTLGLAEGCRYKGTVVHEIGHAVGFHHEQNRPDRDYYVTIKEANIPVSRLYNFKKYSWDVIETHGVPYDYRSVMHYGGRFFSLNGELTVQTKHPEYQNVIGNQDSLSFFDIKLANLMYKCNSKCANVRCPYPGFLGKDCQCWCRGRPVQLCGDSTNVLTTGKQVTTSTTPLPICRNKNKYCQAWTKAGFCRTNSYVKMYCREACNTCTYVSNPTVTVGKDVKTKSAVTVAASTSTTRGLTVSLLVTTNSTRHLMSSSLVLAVSWLLLTL